MVHGFILFIHIRVKPQYPEIITAESDYGIKVPAVVEKENFWNSIPS